MIYNLEFKPKAIKKWNKLGHAVAFANLYGDIVISLLDFKRGQNSSWIKLDNYE
jgi:mRNA-degrading endonuclease RelE of RelBE toxin-antitoxin system